MSTHPDNIGPYRVIAPIAAGGMAEVFEVEDPASGERLALKLLQNLKVALKRFNREYEAMARLNHPGVVRVFHYGLYQARPWLTMELLQGTNAHIWTKQFGSPGASEREDEVLRLAYHLSTALHYVHDRGLVHRDLKSANVVVLPDSRVKLVDFGTAHLVDAAERITRESEFVGTFAYASPEQLKGHKTTHKTDLYSLGVLLYRLTTGRRPFAARDPSELAWQHINEPPPDPRSFVSNLPGPLVDLMLSLLAKDPSDRPGTAGQVAVSLERLAGRPFRTRHPLVLHRSRATSRHAERAELWERIDSAVAGGLYTVVGEPGADTNRMIRDMARDASRRGVPCLELTLEQRRDLTALTRMFLYAARGVSADPRVASAVEKIRAHSTIERRAHAESRAAVVEAAAEILAIRARTIGRPLLILVHEATNASAMTADALLALVEALHQRHAPIRLLLGLSARDLEPARPLSQLARRAVEMWLEPLEPHDVATAVGTMLGRHPPPAHLAGRVHALTGGQPLYLEQVVADLVASREILADDVRLEWADQDVAFQPPRMARRDAERILASLPLSLRRVLEVLAVANGGSTELLASVLGWSVEEAMPAIQSLVATGILRWETVGTTQPGWGHPAAEDLVRSRMSVVRHAVLRRKLASLLMHNEDPDAVQVRALVAAGYPVEAARVAAPVCRALLRDHRPRTALKLLEPLVRKLGGRAVSRDVAFAESFLLYSLALQAVNPAHTDTARSLNVARRLAKRSAEMTARVQWGQATMARAIGHYRNYQKFIETALSTLGSRLNPEVAHTHAGLKMEQGHSLRLQGAVVRARESYMEAEEIGWIERDIRLVARASVGVASCLYDLGELVESERVASRAMSQLERLHDPHGFWQALAIWGHAVRRQARYSDAFGVLYRRAPEARQSEDPRSYSALLLTLAWCELDLERLGRAQEYVDELSAILGRDEYLHVRLEANLVHGRILLTSGQRRQAAYLLQEVEQKARLAELRVLAEQARAWHAEALWQLGDKDTARSMYQSAVLGLMGLNVRPALADACISRARSMFREMPIEQLYQPVRKWMQTEHPPLVHMEELLARGAAARRSRNRQASRQAYRDAAMVLNRVATDLNDTDRAALRVHSWSRRIRRGLQ